MALLRSGSCRTCPCPASLLGQDSLYSLLTSRLDQDLAFLQVCVPPTASGRTQGPGSKTCTFIIY